MINIVTERSKNPITVNDDFSKFLPRVAEILEESIIETVLVGGRPSKWIPTKSGLPPLKGRGVLWSTLKKETGSNYAQAGWGSGLKYAWIHQKGGWAGRNHASYIPARPQTIQKQDIDTIRKMFVRTVLFSEAGLERGSIDGRPI